jgi:predicted short-subunit dehydrogenase-like oxidoreductase (DUF2520 family)
LPQADLLLICVKDDVVSDVAALLADHAESFPMAAHVSGFLPVTALHVLSERDVAVGGFHPLQTLPDPKRGAAALAGSYAGIGGDQLATDTLTHFATSLGMQPFSLDDDQRPAYHAAAAATANFVITSLAVAGDLFSSVGIDERVARPLVEHAISNLYELGADEVLTGPIARGDIETVIGHLTAAHMVSEDVGAQFRLIAEATAVRAGRRHEVAQWK